MSRLITQIIVHCSATKPTQDISKEIIKQWHLDRGFRDIGYHYIIRRNGQIEWGRPLEQKGAHALGYNEHSIGCCLVGGINKEGKPDFNYTSKQMVNLWDLVQLLCEQYPTISDICGHRDLPGVTKACPVFDVRRFFYECLEQTVRSG